MPLRVPPPEPTTKFEQYVIDSLAHLDECLDDHKNNMRDEIAEIKTALQDLNAQDHVQMAAISGEGGVRTLLDAHKHQHDLLEARSSGSSAILKTQGSAIREVLHYLGPTGLLLIGAGLLRALGA